MPEIKIDGHHPVVDATYKKYKRDLELETSEEKALRILSEKEETEKDKEEN